MKTPAPRTRAELIATAFEAIAGPALLLDEHLEVRLATPAATALLGVVPRVGLSAPALLCGDRPKRPIAEALAAGRPIQALIPRPEQGEAGELVLVRSLPLRHGRKKIGWVLLLSASPSGASEPELFHGLWSADLQMKRLFRVIEKVARDESPVLVRGETGAGKELVARALHDASHRAAGPFRAINCAALPSTLLESELFGHAKGAFTGAVKDTPGHIQLAHGGTLFLDEVAEVPLELQAKLLRVLETRQVLPVGGREPIPVDVRIVSATHRSLREAVEAGRFRGDLMYRLRVIPLFLPPLRERPNDVALLTEHLLSELGARERSGRQVRQVQAVSPAALAALERHPWPGNVRELRNALAYAVAIGDGPILELADLPPEIADPELGPFIDMSAAASRPAQPSAPTARPARPLAAPEPAASLAALSRRIEAALAAEGGHRARAAARLGMSRITLWRKLKELGLG
ncbi:MAG: sigma 54-interacting transcriptional regulator [Deltaproteobacteria bacterium]|nr:sigma 54-interacting transcriptional regulator [Deltaproteobacteria bacterium]